jgi:HK97 family phage major capsid protein
MAREILIGDGGAGHFTGIFNAPENVIPAASDLTLSTIDADTLDQIVFNYGGDEDVEGSSYLILSKKDLAAFAAIRAEDGKKLYKITVNGNTGTISSDGSFSVNYVINSACPTLSLSGTASGTYCMAYGPLQNYEMAVFSDIDVEMSTDFKFGQGMVAYAGDIYAGGNVTAYKGFLRIKKQ